MGRDRVKASRMAVKASATDPDYLARSVLVGVRWAPDDVTVLLALSRNASHLTLTGASDAAAHHR
jgi:hypothetical protein